MSQFWAKSENLFSRRKMAAPHKDFEPKFQNFKLIRIFFQLEKMEFKIFQIQKKLSYLNFIWQNFEQNQRTFFDHSVGR